MSKSNPTIQEKIAQLDEIVEWFENQDFELEHASEKLKLAAKLATDIEHDLDEVANDIHLIKKSFANESVE